MVFMYECEICGKQTSVLNIIELEGAHVAVCERCATGKYVIDTMGDEKPARKKSAQTGSETEEDEIVSDYGNIIRKARESMNMPLKVLGEIINEKESTLFRVEKGKMLPDAKLTKKLEKELGIKLTAKATTVSNVKIGRSEPVTLGEAAIKKEKKQ